MVWLMVAGFEEEEEGLDCKDMFMPVLVWTKLLLLLVVITLGFWLVRWTCCPMLEEGLALLGNDWVCPFEKEEDDPEDMVEMENEVVGRPGVVPFGDKEEEEVEAEAIKALWLALGIGPPA